MYWYIRSSILNTEDIVRKEENANPPTVSEELPDSLALP